MNRHWINNRPTARRVLVAGALLSGAAVSLVGAAAFSDGGVTLRNVEQAAPDESTSTIDSPTTTETPATTAPVTSAPVDDQLAQRLGLLEGAVTTLDQRVDTLEASATSQAPPPAPTTTVKPWVAPSRCVKYVRLGKTYGYERETTASEATTVSVTETGPYVEPGSDGGGYRGERCGPVSAEIAEYLCGDPGNKSREPWCEGWPG